MRFSKYKLAKYLLICVNLIYAILGAAMLAVGLGQKTSSSGALGGFPGGVTLWAPLLLICAGIALFVIAVFGSLATLSENYWALATFGTLLACTVLVQSVAGVASLFISGQMPNYVRDVLRYEIHNYDDGPTIIDVIQIKMSCCGGNNSDDWIQAKGCLPKSCCPQNPPSDESMESSALGNNTNLVDKGHFGVFTRILTLARKIWLQNGGASVTTEAENKNNGPVNEEILEKMAEVSTNSGDEKMPEIFSTSAEPMETRSVETEITHEQKELRHLHIEGFPSTAKPLINWPDYLYKRVKINDTGNDKTISGGDAIEGTKAEFCYNESRICCSNASQIDGCRGPLIQKVTDDALFAGVAALVMASLQLIALPITAYVVSVISVSEEQIDRRYLF